MKKLLKLIVLASLINLIFIHVSYSAALEVNIVKNKIDPIPVLLTNFSKSRIFDLSKIIQRDLTRNKEFLVKKDSQINLLNYKNSFSEINARGVDAVIVGGVEALNSGLYRISYKLVDFYLKKTIAKNSWDIPVEMLSNVAHKISDEIYQTMLGYSGDFASKIAYISYKKTLAGDLYTLEIADSDGKNANTALRSSNPILSPTWSKDGKKIAYVSFESGRSRIYIQDVYTRRKRFIVPDFGGVAGAPSFSNDNLKIAIALSYRGNQDIYVYNLKNGKMKRITRHPNIDTEPEWSPDDKFIYFTSDRSKVPQIYKVNLSNLNVDRVSYSGRNNSSVTISKNGSIAMIEGNYGDYHLSLLDSDGRSVNALTKGPNDESPSFSPNGKMLIFAANQNGQGILATISLTTGLENKLILKDGAIREPNWGP